MKKVYLSALAAVSLGLVGCGGSVCSRLDSVGDSLASKKGTCDSTVTVNMTEAQCTERLAECTGEDMDKLHAWFDCMEALPACEAATEEDFTNSFLQCATDNLVGMSDPCTQAFTGG